MGKGSRQFLQMWAEQQLPILGASGDSPNLERQLGAVLVIQEDPEWLPDMEQSLRMGFLCVQKEHLSLTKLNPFARNL